MRTGHFHINIVPVFGFVCAVSFAGCSCREWPACDTDDECVGYQQDTPFCVDNQCVQCRAGADCEGCSECRANSCLAFQCCSTEECPGGEICENHRCTTGCDALRPCPDGLTCQNARCVECLTDADCSGGATCENNRCVFETACDGRALQTVFFDFDESAIRNDQTPRLDQNVVCLNTFMDDFSIEGHCDERGTDAYNMALGDRRARIIRQYLERVGVHGGRMRTVSYGESRPSSPGHTERAWSQNRRAELIWR